MKKTFGIIGTGLLLLSNVLMSFSNVSFAIPYDYGMETETKGCYVYKHNYQAYLAKSIGGGDSYLGSELVSYKCDEKGGEVDLRKAPLEEGQYIIGIGADAFFGTNVTKVILPSTVEFIGDRAFCNVERLGEPECGDGIIDKDLGEECDDGNKFQIRGMNDNYICNSECRKEAAPICGNGKLEQGETCNNCRVDVEADGGSCIKSIELSENNETPESELLLKGSLPIGEYDDSDFIIVDFPDGMNDEFNIEDLDYACAKLQEYLVTFETEDGDELGTGETFNQHMLPFIIPEAPEKEGFIGTWYLGNEIFDFNSQITDNITLVYKYEKGGIEYDKENGLIKVSLGDQEIIVKDKNQGAEKSFNEVGTEDPSDLINAVGTYYFWGNNTGLDLKQITVPDDIDNIPEGFDHGYLGMQGGNDWTAGSDDTPCNVDSGEYLPSPDEWIKLMQIWGKVNGYELNHDNMGYYFDDMNMGYVEQKNVTKSLTLERAYGGMDSSITKFLNDLYIGFYPSLYIDNGGISFNSNMQFYPSSLNNGKIGYFTSNGLRVYDESSLYGFENNIATPVRCFIKPQFEVSFEVNGGTDVVTQKIFSGNKATEPEVQKENAEFLGWFKEDGTIFKFDTPITSDIKLHAEWQEKKSNSSYSGGGGGKSSSSNTAKTEDKVHNSADDKVTSKSEEKVKNNQIDIVNSKTQIEKKSDELSQKAVYHPDNTLTEEEQAYDFAHTYGITTKTSVENAKMDNSLTRIQMAKMLSQYAVNVLGKEPDVSKGVTRFSDVTNKMNKDYDNGVNLAYQLGIMGQNMKDNKFRPNDEVTRAEFVTALSRMLYNTSDGEYKSTPKYYIHHMQKLKSEGIITNDNPKMKEKRGYVMLMLLRSVK